MTPVRNATTIATVSHFLRVTGTCSRAVISNAAADHPTSAQGSSPNAWNT